MKEKINISKKLNISHQEPFYHLSLYTKKSSSNNKEQILFNHKCSLETLLNIIKNSQLEYLSKESKKNNIKKTKQIIKSLKENLNLMLKEKNKKLNYIKNKNEISKKDLLFPISKNSKQIKYNIKTENNKIYSSILEKNQLELLNFQIINEIEKINFLIEQKVYTYSTIKQIPFFYEINREIYCNNNYNTITKITRFLKEIIRGVRKDFIDIVKEKMNKELEINEILLKINNIKDNIEDYKLKGCKKYINSEDIIQEDSSEYIRSIIINESKRNSLSKTNNKNIIKLKNNINLKESKKDNNKLKQRIIKDKIRKNNVFYTNKINKSDINNNNINNYLNMNINVNINLNNNNLESFNSSLDSKEEDDNEEIEKNGQYEMDLNENNKIIITQITTNENFNRKNNR